MRTTHDWARDLQRTAEFLLSRAEIELLETLPVARMRFWGGEGKGNFLKLVRATTPGKKEISEYTVAFCPTGANLEIAIDRSVICRKVQEEKYECEPLLSPEEDAEMGQAEVTA